MNVTTYFQPLYVLSMFLNLGIVQPHVLIENVPTKKEHTKPDFFIFEHNILANEKYFDTRWNFILKRQSFYTEKKYQIEFN